MSTHNQILQSMPMKNLAALIISGVGAIKSAAATAFLKAYFNIKNRAAWINLGIAGIIQSQ